MSSELEASVAEHYRPADLLETILAGVKAAGADPNALTPEDLAPVDEFHTAGRVTTLKALAMTPLESGMHVLDAGCGIGGTARVLAHAHGCRVTGIDLTPEYIDVAEALSARMGLADRCAFKTASVLDMPFDDDAFDAAVTFHVAMNVADREGFYNELARVLRPGAPLCVFDVMKGPTPGMIYPVPWAETETTSVLKSPQETRTLLERAGFRVTAEESMRVLAIDYFRDAFAAAETGDGPPPLGLHLLTGANAADKFANYARALNAHQIEPVILVATRA